MVTKLVDFVEQSGCFRTLRRAEKNFLAVESQIYLTHMRAIGLDTSTREYVFLLVDNVIQKLEQNRLSLYKTNYYENTNYTRPQRNTSRGFYSY